MVDWHVVAECEWLGPNFGQSEYIDISGYTEGTMDSQNIQTDGEVGDPFLSYGIDTETWTFGQAQMEIGLIGSHRIRINSSGVRIWTAGDVWEDPLAGGAGGEANTASSQGSGTSIYYQKSGVDLQFNAIKSENTKLSVALDGTSHDVELTINEGNIDHNALNNYDVNKHFLKGDININDLGDVVIDTPVDNEVLAWDNGTSKWINQTPAEAGLATAGHGHAQLHDEDHDNVHHTTNYHTEVDGTGVATVHSDIVSTGSQSIITTNERNALHTIYSLEEHNNDYHNPNYKVDFSENTAFNKDFGTLGTEVCVGNDSRLNDARTPTAHILATTGPHTGTLPWGDLNKTGSNLTDLITRQHAGLTDVTESQHHTKYTNAEAVQAVEDTGLVLSSTKVITSADEELHFLFGKLRISNWDLSDSNTFIGIGHRDLSNSTGNYAIAQREDGHTYLNAADGKHIGFTINGIQSATYDINGFQLGTGAKITIFDNAALGNSATKAPTSNAVKTYVDNNLHAAAHTLASHTTKAHSELTDYNAETDVKHLTDSQLGDLHEIYTLEVHDNTKHDPDYKADFSENSAFNKNFGTLGTEVCVGNDARLSDARTPTAHVLATSGPHSDSLPLADLADYTAGRIIYGGASDWQFLALGTENYVLKAGATYPAWGQVDWSELSGKPGTFPPSSHAFSVHTVPTANIPMNTKKFTGLVNGSAAQDSMAFGQKYTLEVHDNDEHSPNYSAEGHDHVEADITDLDHFDAADARGAINDIIGADGKLDANLDFDGAAINNVSYINSKADVNAYRLINSTFSIDHHYQGNAMIITTNGGSIGVPMYSDTTANRVSVCVDTSINTMPCIGLYIGSNLILTHGTIRDDSWNFNIGKPVYVNGSSLSTTIPPDVGDIVQVVGVSITATSMHFNPSPVWGVRK